VLPLWWFFSSQPKTQESGLLHEAALQASKKSGVEKAEDASGPGLQIESTDEQ
jgi:hypothetical protein